MELLKFEIKKIITSKKFKILWSLVIVLIGIFIILASNSNNIMKPFESGYYMDTIEDIQLRISDFSSKIELEKDIEIKEAMEESINRWQEELILNQNIMNGIMENDNSKILENEIKILENIQEDILSGKLQSSGPVEEFQAKIDKYKYLYQNNIKPINEHCDMTFANYLNLILKYIAPMLIGIVVILTTSDIVSKETDYGTIQILIFQQASRWKIINTKIITSILVNLVLSFSSIILVGLISALFNGIGNFNYPVVLQADNITKIISMKEFIFQNSIIFMIFIIFLTVFSTLISTIVKNSTESTATSITICIGSTLILNSISLPKWIQVINPFSYLTGNQILVSGFTSQPINFDINIIFVLIAFLVYISISIILSIIIFKKKEFNIEN